MEAEQSLKRCTVCKQWLPLARFGKASLQGDGLNYRCRICHVLASLSSRGGAITTRADYEALLIEQEGRCAICKRLPEEAGGVGSENGSFHIDHDHDTKRIRGLLCLKCNVMLGNARDDAATLRAGAEYLERFMSHDPGEHLDSVES